MKNLRQMKKWTLMSVLLCGISLAAFAFAPQVRIIWWTLTDITSSSAHLVVYHQGAHKFQLKIYNGDQVVREVEQYTGATSTDEEIFYAMDLVNLRPNTTYKLEIIVIGFPGETENPKEDMREVYFTTDSEVQP